MTTVDGAPCPVCGGRQLLGHPAGRLAWRHENVCSLRDREDSRHVADLDALTNGRAIARRPATETERILLAVLGHQLPDALTTELALLTTTIVARRWPDLVTTTEGTAS